MSDVNLANAPSRSQVLKGTAVAVLIGVLLLTFVVLPAEYGVDPTGIGARIGLKAMGAASDQEEDEPTQTDDAADPAAASTPISVFDAVWKSDVPFRTDEMSLTLQPNEGGEIKALMQPGERLVFSWTAEGGAVNFDMHGEETNAGNDEFTSYWKGRAATNGSGAFQAPFAGTHGWYWRNRGSEPVTVRVKTSGYYEKLFRP